MASYNTSQFKKGLKVQLDGDPYLMIECNFVKPGKGQALYKCKLRNLIRGTMLDRTYKSGDSIDAADIEEISAQFLYRQQDQFVFMDNESYEQYELTKEQVDDGWKYLKEGMICAMTLFNGQPLSVSPPNHVVLKVEYAEPGAPGQYGDQRHQALPRGDRRRYPLSRIRRNRRSDPHRHADGRIHRAGEGVRKVATESTEDTERGRERRPDGTNMGGMLSHGAAVGRHVGPYQCMPTRCFAT